MGLGVSNIKNIVGCVVVFLVTRGERDFRCLALGRYFYHCVFDVRIKSHFLDDKDTVFLLLEQLEAFRMQMASSSVCVVVCVCSVSV